MLVYVLVLGAKPVTLIASYKTRGFVEEKNECPIGKLHMHMCAVRGYSISNSPIVLS